MKNLFAIAFTILFITACKKEKLPSAGGTQLDKTIAKNTSGALVGTTYYTYNSDNKLVKITNWDATAPISFSHMEYDASGRLSKYTYESAAAGVIEYYNYQYDASNRVIRAIGTPVLPGLALEDFSYTYDAQNRIIADSSFDSGVLTKYFVYAYDSKNNVTSYEQLVKTGIGFVSQGVIGVQYDDKVNPYKLAGNIFYHISQNGYSYLSSNNIISYSPALGSLPVQYEYFSNGYVKKMTVTGGSFTIEYYYK